MARGSSPRHRIATKRLLSRELTAISVGKLLLLLLLLLSA